MRRDRRDSDRERPERRPRQQEEFREATAGNLYLRIEPNKSIKIIL